MSDSAISAVTRVVGVINIVAMATFIAGLRHHLVDSLSGETQQVEEQTDDSDTRLGLGDPEDGK